MNAPHDQPPPCLFVAANDDPEELTWRDIGRLLVCDLAVALLMFAGWAAFGWFGAWLVTP